MPHNSQKMKHQLEQLPLMEMTIDTGDSNPVLQKPYPIAMKNYQWVKEEIEKLLTAEQQKNICYTSNRYLRNYKPQNSP